MNTALDIFNPQVTKSASTITVTYCHLNYSGTCTYNETTLQGTKFKQRVNILINTDMDDVIEYLYKIGEVTGPQDLERISYLIQTHSRTQIE
jgi:uncharacterized protein YraI